VISTFVVTVALLLASTLLQISQERLALAAQQALDPLPELALGQLRADLLAASGVAGGEVLWSRGRLRLFDHPAGRIDFLLVDGQILRRVRLEDGSQEERVLLSGVVTWRWRQPYPGLDLVQVEVGYRRHERLRSVDRGKGEILPVARERRRRLEVSPRGDGGEGW
jgi:hypothetical protein